MSFRVLYVFFNRHNLSDAVQQLCILACVQMENIQLFLNFCESYGVPKTGLFQTVDLFEGRNLPQVLNCIQQLGTEASMNGMITDKVVVRHIILFVIDLESDR